MCGPVVARVTTASVHSTARAARLHPGPATLNRCFAARRPTCRSGRRRSCGEGESPESSSLVGRGQAFLLPGVSVSVGTVTRMTTSSDEDAAWVDRYRPLVEHAFAMWLENREWPAVERLQRDLDVRGADVSVLDAYSELPRLGNQVRPLYPSAIALPLHVLRYLPDAMPILEVCLLIIRRGIEIYTSGADELELHGDDSKLLDRVGDSAALLSPAADLLRSDYPSPFGGSNWGEGAWRLQINGQSAREFRQVTTLAEYFSRQADIMSNTRAGWQLTAPTSARVLSGFILMPFSEDWSAGVYDLIKRATDALRPELQITVERADEISRPGKITDQIIQAIREADIIIADITGNNANVMWELGYAQALGKDPVILNQAVQATPFDLHDWRQVIYSRTPAETDQIKISKHLREAAEAAINPAHG